MPEPSEETTPRYDLLWRRLRGSAAAVEALVSLTRCMDEHPEDYDGPCECRECLSYGN